MGRGKTGDLKVMMKKEKSLEAIPSTPPQKFLAQVRVPGSVPGCAINVFFLAILHL